MAFSQSDLDNLNAAIAEGVTSCSQNGRQVVFRSLADMLKLRGIMEVELGLGVSINRTRVYASFRRD